MPTYVLDTSVLIAYLGQEPRAEQLRQYRKTAHLPFVVLTELYYVIFRKHGPIMADETLQQVLGWHLPLLMPDERICLSAGYLKGKFALGIADSYIAAFALALNAVLVTKDSDYGVLKPDIQLVYL